MPDAAVIPLRLASAEPTISELAEQVAMLAALVTELRAQLAEFELRLPRKPRFTVPNGWVSLKDAIAMSGLSKSTIYRGIKKGPILAVKVGVTWVDPATLPRVEILNL